MSLNRLPDELLRTISDFGGVGVAKNMAQTSAIMRNIYNIDEILRAFSELKIREDVVMDIDRRIQSMIDETQEETGYFENDMSRMQNIMNLVRFVVEPILSISDNSDMTPEQAEQALREWFPRWFYLSAYMGRIYDEYASFWARESMNYPQESGPNTIDAISKMECMDLLSITLHLMNVFNGWVFGRMKYKNRHIFQRGIMIIANRVYNQYNKVETLFNTRMMDASRMTSRMYSTEQVSYRPKSRRSKKKKTRRYSLRIPDQFRGIPSTIEDQIIEQYMSIILPSVNDNREAIADAVMDVIRSRAISKDDGSTEIWQLKSRNSACGTPEFEGNLEYAIMMTEDYMRECGEQYGSPSHWMNDIQYIIDQIEDTIRLNIHNPHLQTIMENKFSLDGVIKTLYRSTRRMMVDNDEVWLERIA